MAPKINSGFDIDLDSFQAAAENYKSIIALFTEAGLNKLISTRCRLLEIELTELMNHAQISEQGEITGTLHETPVSISAEHLRDTFDLPSGGEPVELTPEEIKNLLITMKFSRDRPINLKKIDFSDEYRLLADIVGKILLCKISAHDAVPKQQLNIMGALVLKKKIDWASCLLKMIGYKYSHKENAYMRIMSQVLLHSFPDLCRSKGIPIPPGKRMSIALFSKWTRQIPKPGSIPERTPSPPNSSVQPTSIPPPPPSNTPHLSDTVISPPSSPPPLSPPPTQHEPSSSTQALLLQCIQQATHKFQAMLDGHCSQLHSSIMHMQTQIDGVNASVQSLKSSISSSRVTTSFLTSLAKKVKKGEKLDEEQPSSHKSHSHKSPPTSKSDSLALLKTIGNEKVPELHSDEQITDVLSIAREAEQQVVVFQREASRVEKEVEKEAEPDAVIAEDGAGKEAEEAEKEGIKEVPSQGEQTALTQGELNEHPATGEHVEKEQLTSIKRSDLPLVFSRKRKTPPTPPE